MLNEIDLSRADLNLLTLFEVVLRERHVGRAAAQLNLSPSAVSHGLRRLRLLLNDPLFLRTPKGVVPTARAAQLAEPISDVLARVRHVISSAEAFDPARSSRRFIIGAPDGISSVILYPLLSILQSRAPGIDIGLRQLLPPQGGRSPDRAWEPVLSDLEAGAMDIAIAPIDSVPTRFVGRTIFEEDFVVVARPRHPFAVRPTLDRFCKARHLVVSLTGDAHGFVDSALEGQGLARRVALTVPDFAMALATVAETDLIAAMPRRFVAMQARRFGLVSREVPLRLRKYAIRAIATRAAMMDAGLAWLFGVLQEAVDVGEKERGGVKR
ncbi:LysR family transcriptional regulator [Bradyrhizobium sp. LHD-71]|uniref:LysR family transcriptional regulator n=1 Tax=Bradyrhizobium sp. LHD-71 TaxID=3072141 RepID=UPI002810400D|nr:LysR family transcriptional regulator [Bradyrhizobium sp. LHD-71]MDQ8729601.1 LysR family transcriptional regulator [Bradyrhizobium sp. LHD-71]